MPACEVGAWIPIRAVARRLTQLTVNIFGLLSQSTTQAPLVLRVGSRAGIFGALGYPLAAAEHGADRLPCVLSAAGGTLWGEQWDSPGHPRLPLFPAQLP